MQRLRWGSVILMVALLVTALAGCGGSQQPVAKPDAKPDAKADAKADAKPATAAPAAPAPAKPAEPAKVRQLAFGGTRASSSHYAYFAAAAKSVNTAVKGVQVTVVESGASIDNLNRIRTKEFDLGLSNISTAFEAYSGLSEWKDKKIPNLRWMWSYAVSPYLILVRDDSGITSLQQLDGKDFSPGGTGSTTAQATERVITALGVKPKFYRGSHEDGANALKNRQAVGFAKISSGILARDSMIMDIQSTTKIRFLSFTPADVEKVKQQYNMYAWITVPPNVYDGQTQELTTHGDLSGIVSTAELPQDLVYQMVKAVFADKKAHEAAFGGIKETDYVKDAVLKSPIIPLHAGLVQYLKEQGVNVPQALIPPEYKG